MASCGRVRPPRERTEHGPDGAAHDAALLCLSDWLGRPVVVNRGPIDDTSPRRRPRSPAASPPRPALLRGDSYGSRHGAGAIGPLTVAHVPSRADPDAVRTPFRIALGLVVVLAVAELTRPPPTAESGEWARHRSIVCFGASGAAG
jgi:hypothetical protein